MGGWVDGKIYRDCEVLYKGMPKNFYVSTINWLEGGLDVILAEHLTISSGY